MEFITVHDPNLRESCPTVDRDGYFTPNDNQTATIIGRSGGLNPSLMNTSIVQWGDATGTLATAAAWLLIVQGHASVTPGFGGADNPDLPIAIADLAVTGADGYASFVSVSRPPFDDEAPVSLTFVRSLVRARLPEEATRIGATLDVGIDSAEVAAAVEEVVARALGVIWALNGPAEYRGANRSSLGWIAVNAMRDFPRRPVNVPCADWPMADTLVTVAANGGTITCRTRYAVAGATEDAAPADISNALPVTDRPPVIDPEARIIVFLHGHSSFVEEATMMYAALHDEVAASRDPVPFVLVAFDFPSNGYSQYFDHDAIAPFTETTAYSPDHPEVRRFGILELYERFVVAFVEALDRDMIASGQAGVLNRIAAIIGGSMGGNLALRLSERLVTSPWWLDALVAWSPASAYESFANKDYFIPSPGEETDPIGKQALDRTSERCMEPEGDDTRAQFFALQLDGERLINDGTTEFEVITRLLGVFVQPILGGIAPFIPFAGALVGPLLSGIVGPIAFGSGALEGVANITAVKQSDTWLRAECRESYDPWIATRNFTQQLEERYSPARRRTHWRVAYEQLLFSHQDEVAASRGRKCYELSSIPTLLVAGGDDTVDTFTGFDIVGGVRRIAPMMTNPGKAIVIEHTGHSIDHERPKWFAREILRFLESVPVNEIVAVTREDGRIVRLHFAPPDFEVAAPRSVQSSEVIRRARWPGGFTPYWVRAPDQSRTRVYARRILTTTPDERTDNNLRALPETSLPELEGWQSFAAYGPITGFPVTHIRLRTTGELPWETWVSHLCNDAMRVQIPTAEAELRILGGGARYFIETGGETTDLRVVEYLYSAPNATTEDNLSSLPEVDS
jgi:pimeloyl-ACP methyl ester carboxylesterase